MRARAQAVLDGGADRDVLVVMARQPASPLHYEAMETEKVLRYVDRSQHALDHAAVSRGLTATMVQAAFAPDAALQSNFGETVSGPLAHLVARNWGALIALIGGMLIYGAFNPLQRPLVLIVAGSSKVTPSHWCFP